jgi:hypothetical protein
MWLIALKVTVTVVLPLTATVQEPVPLHADHPAKVVPFAGDALRVTEVPGLKPALQTEPQLMPGGVLVTVPVPGPARVTVSIAVRGGGTTTPLNEAVTEALPFKLNVHDPVPLHAPLQPAKIEFAAGVAVRVIDVPLLNAALQVVPQLMPAGLLETVPLPVPERVRANTGELANVAETLMFELSVTVQVLDPLHAPPQFTNADPGFAVAVSVTAVPAGKLPLQVGPQLMPLGLLTTAPLPVTCTVSCDGPEPMDTPLQPVRTKMSASENPKQTNPTLYIFSPVSDRIVFVVIRRAFSMRAPER